MKKAWQIRLTNNVPFRIGLGLFAVVFLLFIYVTQRTSYAHLLGSLINYDISRIHPYFAFIFNKTLRLVFNDGGCFLLIYAIFTQKKYLKVAFYVFLFELVVILPAYFLIKLSLEGDSELSSPLLSQVHRLIVNPTLMVLLIVGFYYQEKIQG